MKKLISLLFLSYFLVGCGAVNSKMNKTLDNIQPGMTIQEFKKVAPKATLVQLMENLACYKLSLQSAKFGEPGGYVYSTRFFYFRDNKLYRIDEGTRATDLKIEIDKTIHNN